MSKESGTHEWEKGYEKPWEKVTAGETEALAQISSLTEKLKTREYEDKRGKLGIIRNLVLIIDYSGSMQDKDLKPSRQACTYKLVCDFIQQFLDGNSISQLGIIVTYNKRAEKITDLCGNPVKLTEDFKKWNDQNSCRGEPSLQNSLELAFTMLKDLPTYSSREVVLIYGSLTVVDPGDVYNVIQSMKENGIRCSAIGLSAEMYIYKNLCSATGGNYNVILDDMHFQQLLFNHVKPQASSSNLVATCVKMGFCQPLDSSSSYSTCTCHLKDPTKVNAPGYVCPQCKSKYCELPTTCKTCGIYLVMSSHLLQPIHYLIPVPLFKRVADTRDVACHGCAKLLKAKDNQVLCESCNNIFCGGCDDFIHNKVHVCPGCAG